METIAVYTIGYGARSLPEVISLLKQYDIQFVIDIRSAPYSSFKPEFSRPTLQQTLEASGFRYVFMGDLLGGQPDDAACYRNDRVDYEEVRQTAGFRQGIERIEKAWRQRLRICLLCSEGKPEECHRSKLIGQVLEEMNIPVDHIALDGSLYRQEKVIHMLTGGQQFLFGTEFTSRKKYRTKSSDRAARD